MKDPRKPWKNKSSDSTFTTGPQHWLSGRPPEPAQLLKQRSGCLSSMEDCSPGGDQRTSPTRSPGPTCHVRVLEHEQEAVAQSGAGGLGAREEEGQQGKGEVLVVELALQVGLLLGPEVRRGRAGQGLEPTGDSPAPQAPPSVSGSPPGSLGLSRANPESLSSSWLCLAWCLSLSLWLVSGFCPQSLPASKGLFSCFFWSLCVPITQRPFPSPSHVSPLLLSLVFLSPPQLLPLLRPSCPSPLPTPSSNLPLSPHLPAPGLTLSMRSR